MKLITVYKHVKLSEVIVLQTNGSCYTAAFIDFYSAFSTMPDVRSGYFCFLFCFQKENMGGSSKAGCFLLGYQAV